MPDCRVSLISICLLQAYVLLKANPDYDNIHITSWWTSAYAADVARFVKVRRKENESSSICIVDIIYAGKKYRPKSSRAVCAGYEKYFIICIFLHVR